MKNIDVLELHEMLTHYSKDLKDLKGAKFAYTIIKNIDILNKESKDIKAVKKNSEKYLELEKKRLELCEKYSDKDSDNNPLKNEITKNTFEYIILKNKEDFNNAVSSLFEENKDAIDEQESLGKEYYEFLNSESTIEFKKIELNDIPSDISVELFNVIKKFIKDDE